jgi:hypothetical protein
MNNTARAIIPPIPAHELFQRAIAGETVTGVEILASLGADIERKYLVGPQSVLTLVRENPAIDESEIKALMNMLQTGVRRSLSAKPNIALSYQRALRECENELERRRQSSQPENVVPLRPHTA